jgi:hypothetical protein
MTSDKCPRRECKTGYDKDYSASSKCHLRLEKIEGGRSGFTGGRMRRPNMRQICPQRSYTREISQGTSLLNRQAHV